MYIPKNKPKSTNLSVLLTISAFQCKKFAPCAVTRGLVFGTAGHFYALHLSICIMQIDYGVFLWIWSKLYWLWKRKRVDTENVSFIEFKSNLSRLVTKPTKWPVRPAKTQISLGIRPVWSESSLCAQWVAKDPSFLHADSEDSDQTGRMPRLIWVFAGRTCHFVGFVTRRLV